MKRRKVRHDTRTVAQRYARALHATGPFTVNSHADGSFRIYPEWSGCQPPIGKRYHRAAHPVWNEESGRHVSERCPECDGLHVGGLFDRMGMAEVIEKLLNAAAAQERPRTRRTR